MNELVDVYLDIAFIKCPHCGKMYVDASWYVIELSSDTQCNICGETFNTGKNVFLRSLLKFNLDTEKRKIKDIEIVEYLSHETCEQ